jgi:hypothetical protein
MLSSVNEWKCMALPFDIDNDRFDIIKDIKAQEFLLAAGQIRP